MSDRRKFWIALTVVALVALTVRLAYIALARRGLTVGGDSLYYHEGANLLAKGKGYIDPYQYLTTGKSVAAADHPPAYLTYLALFSLVGLKSATAHMVASALVGVGTVVVVGLVGREIAGPRLGVIAAAIAAVYPNLWAYDGALESETIAQLAVALTFLATYVWWRDPTRRNAALIGAAVALGALARAEMALLALLLIVPLVVWRAGLERRERLRQLAVAWLTLALVVAPWCAYNLARFDRPTLLSTGFGVALDSSACDAAFYGPFTGYWSRACVLDAEQRSGLPSDADRSVLEVMHRENAVRYIDAHLSRLPVVMFARVGRVAGLFQLRQQAALDSFVAGREHWVAWSAWWSFFALAALSVAGAVVLRRRRVPVFPILSLPVLVVVTTAVFFGLVRYRAIAEVSVLLLAAVAIDAVVGARSASMSAP
ncbi:MAG TPA: glycosyltransferase family 39 protein [Acidimicrobiales bacterium]|jgi:4-amino-4-deoxy-L-arabinose transferase-like glycosyltransferase|nr:glycosyltransferase family 39 protein [Acidimicrobiales bacterium]